MELTWQISGEHLWWFLQSGQSCSLARWKCGRCVQYTWHPKLMLRGACGHQRRVNTHDLLSTLPLPCTKAVNSLSVVKTVQGQAEVNRSVSVEIRPRICFHVLALSAGKRLSDRAMGASNFRQIQGVQGDVWRSLWCTFLRVTTDAIKCNGWYAKQIRSKLLITC